MLVYNITYIDKGAEPMEDMPGTRLLFDDEGNPFPEAKKKVRKQTNQKMSFAEAAKALQTTHTLSTTKICEILKTYRPWVTKYILPKLDKIYLNSGHKGNSRKSNDINWVYAMSRALNDDRIKESAWYKKSDFEELLKKSLDSCTRQTIKVSSSLFVESSKRNKYCTTYKELQDSLDEIQLQLRKEFSRELLDQRKKIYKQIDDLYNEYIGSDLMIELTSKVSIEEYGVSKRTLTPAVKYKIDLDYENFMAVHDLKGYGGIDEQIYRDLFNNGAVKLVFGFVAENGDIGEKIFYLYDKRDEEFRLEDNSPKWTVPYSFFLKYKKV